MKLRDHLPQEFFTEFMDTRAAQMLEVEVVAVHRNKAPFKQKHVHVWWELANGYAIGWNENPSRGWSFPTKRIAK